MRRFFCCSKKEEARRLIENTTSQSSKRRWPDVVIVGSGLLLFGGAAACFYYHPKVEKEYRVPLLLGGVSALLLAMVTMIVGLSLRHCHTEKTEQDWASILQRSSSFLP